MPPHYSSGRSATPSYSWRTTKGECPKEPTYSLDPTLHRRGLACPESFEAAVTRDEDDNLLGLCFLHFELKGTGKSWHVCNAICQGLNVSATLPVMHHKDEIEFASKLALAGRSKQFWVGMSDLGGEGRWTWMDGTKVSNLTWTRQQPSDGSKWWETGYKGCGEDCGSYVVKTSSIFASDYKSLTG